jgi:hypothetical protein
VVLHTQVEGWGPKFGSVKMGSIAELELGEHLISREIAELDLNKTARTGLYAEGAMTKLHAPDQRWCGDTLELLSG